jgi:hypothetical protein
MNPQQVLIIFNERVLLQDRQAGELRQGGAS